MKLCKFCKAELVYSGYGRPSEYCNQEHKRLFQGKKVRKKKVDTRPVSFRSLEEMRQTGMTHDERQLLRQRYADVQIPKEWQERRLKLYEED